MILLWLCAIVYALGEETSAPSAAADTQPAERFAVEMTDGSRVLGVPDIEKIKLHTSYADVDLAMDRIATLQFGAEKDGDVQVTFRNGDELHGSLDAKEIALNTSFGKIAIPVAVIRGIRYAGTGAAALPDGAVLYYTFDGKAEPVRDESKTGNDGVTRNASFADQGKSGAAVSFTGNHSAVVIKDSDSLKLQDFTIAMWIKRGDKNRLTGWGINGDGVLMGFGQNGYGLVLHEPGSTLALTKIGVNAVISELGVNDDQWHHVAVTKQGNIVVFYLDGNASRKMPYAAEFTFETSAAVGARGDDFGNSFKGMVDELIIFKRALPDDEIKRLYEQKK